ncbi:MAG: c-type cytochrome [Caldilineaceae bacterium]|nr:c-type cytochrome [Caldilineaceae bacterium]
MKLPITKSMFLLVLLVASLTACGRTEVPEELLPTRIPELGMDYFYADEATSAESVATEVVADETPASSAAEGASSEEPTLEAAVTEARAASQPAADGGDEAAAQQEGAEPTTTPEPTDEPDATATSDATATPEPTSTPEATATPEPTATAQPTATSEPTAAPEATATPEPTAATEAAPAGDASALPVGVAAALDNADPVRGQQLTLQNACIGCHSVDPSMPMAGPTWNNMAEVAATMVEGESAEEYLYNSIIHPNDFVVEGYTPNVMLQNYGETLSDQDLADIIAYLLTLHGE